MKKLALRIVNSVDWFNLWAGKLCGLLILPMIGIVFYELIARRFFNQPTTWATELTTMIFGVYIVWSTGPSLLAKAQVSMDAFASRWSPRVRATVDACTFVLSFVFCLALVVKSTEYAVESVNIREFSNTPFGQPLYHWRVLIALGLYGLLFQCVADFIRNLWLAVQGEVLE